ncbi:FxsA family protein [Kordiimonas sp. SCSIO 12610]|nr:FxsA family protein [Kordiimonas sp. SCSIO 12610]
MLIDVGSSIGGLQTIMLCLLTAGAGMYLVRLQGLQIFSKMQSTALQGEEIGENLIHGFFLMVAGVFLFIPGFITDAIGGILLVPHIRLGIAKLGLLNMVIHRSQQGQNSYSNTKPYNDNIIIEGEYSEHENTQDKDNIEQK